jgi:hypothetical protein
LFTDRANLFLLKPYFQTIEVKNMIALLQLCHDLTDFKAALANRAIILDLLFNLHFWELVNFFLWKTFANVSDFFLQLEKLFVCHLIWVNVVLKLCLKPHWQNKVIEILGFSVNHVLGIISPLLILVSQSLYFFLHHFDRLKEFLFFLYYL